VIYADGSAYCYGCSLYIKNFTKPRDNKIEVIPEDINARISYIRSLPSTSHRGLIFPFDNTGYYIIWPNDIYFKCRRWIDDPVYGKYINPKNVTQPWFIIRKKSKKLMIVEGEINALSLNTLNLPIDIMSPGSAGQFNVSKCGFDLKEFSNYNQIVMITDWDKAGVTGALKLKSQILPHNPDIKIKLVYQDYNQILTNHGQEGLLEEVKELDL